MDNLLPISLSTFTSGQVIALPAHGPFPAALATKGSVFFLSCVACVHLSCNQIETSWAYDNCPPIDLEDVGQVCRSRVTGTCLVLQRGGMSHTGPAPLRIKSLRKKSAGLQNCDCATSAIIFGECYHNANLTLRNLQQIPKTALLVLLYD